MKLQTIPQNTLAAAMAILTPYCPELSPTALVRAIRQFDPNPRSSTPRLLTKHEAAEILGVSWFTVVEMAKAGRIPAVKLPGGQWRFPEQGLLGGAEND